MLYFIVNEKARSGGSASTWQSVRDALKQKEIPYKAWKTEYRGHASVLAEKISRQKDDDICLIVVGGDGTMNEVINGIADFGRVRFGIIPTGSGNDFARGLHIKGAPVECLEQILENVNQEPQHAFLLDLGQIWHAGEEKPRLFAISAGIGLDAWVCKKALKSKLKDFLNHYGLGKLTYLSYTVWGVLTMKTVNGTIVVPQMEPMERKKALCFAAMNFCAEGGGVPMAPSADAADGKLSVCCIFGLTRIKSFFCLPLLVFGKHTKNKGVSLVDFEECTIELEEPMIIHADGEYYGEAQKIDIRCLPGRLRVLN